LLQNKITSINQPTKAAVSASRKAHILVSSSAILSICVRTRGDAVTKEVKEIKRKRREEGKKRLGCPSPLIGQPNTQGVRGYRITQQRPISLTPFFLLLQTLPPERRRSAGLGRPHLPHSPPARRTHLRRRLLPFVSLPQSPLPPSLCAR
jgi:hypothetical protein